VSEYDRICRQKDRIAAVWDRLGLRMEEFRSMVRQYVVPPTPGRCANCPLIAAVKEEVIDEDRLPRDENNAASEESDETVI
jgi:hypothetical protein